jgi:hypothetical protein
MLYPSPYCNKLGHDLLRIARRTFKGGGKGREKSLWRIAHIHKPIHSHKPTPPPPKEKNQSQRRKIKRERDIKRENRI